QHVVLPLRTRLRGSHFLEIYGSASCRDRTQSREMVCFATGYRFGCARTTVPSASQRAFYYGLERYLGTLVSQRSRFLPRMFSARPCPDMGRCSFTSRSGHPSPFPPVFH